MPAVADFPDVLTTLAGEKITSREAWEAKRKPELKELFQEKMYGRLPPAPPKVTGKLLHEDTAAFGGTGTLREVELQFDAFGKTNPLPIRLLIAMPNQRPAKGVPVFVGPNFSGNHTLSADAKIRLPDAWMYPKDPGVVANRATDAGRGKATTWPLAEIVRRGYAVATFYSGDVQPDRPAVSEAFRALAPDADTATIMAWAWGIHRAVDYVAASPEFDPKRIAAVGHSRLGKTVLVAAAFDERIALAIPHQAGCGGTGPNRHADPKAESIKRITTAFPHWFCGAFGTAAQGDPNDLPFDQHMLAALCAPRPLLYSNAQQDAWANPQGQLDMLKLATPAYKLYGVGGCDAKAMPPLNELSAGRLGYFIRPGAHAMTPADWTVFMDFADRWLK